VSVCSKDDIVSRSGRSKTNVTTGNAQILDTQYTLVHR